MQLLETPEEAIDRLDRNGVLICARNIAGVGGRADIEREKIVRHWRAVAADHAPAGEIEIDDLVLIEPRTGKA